ncbi:MAG TPA: HD domain-containing protein, partial [Thiotrichales bacterium]|nr:HD domain-containing protein [Thiotrichales bacterium]
MNQERNPKHWPDLPSNFAQALPLLQSLPAPSLLIDTLTTWECAQEPDESHIRLRHQLLHWEKQRQQLSNHLPESNEQWENFRRMLLSLLASPLVLLTALAGHLAHLRLFKLMDEAEQQQLAMQTLSVYAPLANRLGLSTWKWEMEDIAFRLSHPQDYSSIAKALASKRTEREAFIAHTISDISALLHAENISVDIAGRPKHIYSIYKKMQRKSLAFEQLYDLHALRLLTHSIEDCYRVLGLLHQHYVPLLSEFDDYIARPKANGYQSIHTIIIGQNGWPVEIQIRTHQMHQLAEEGVAAHWRYKEGAQQDASLTQLVHQLRQSLSGELDAQSFDAWEKELTGKHIFVLTPKGD